MVEPIDPFYRDLGGRVRRQRSIRQWSQERLGKSLPTPLTRASIANIEAGAQRLYAHTLAEMAAALEVEVTALIPERMYPPLAVEHTHDLAKELATKLGKSREEVVDLASSILKTRRKVK